MIIEPKTQREKEAYLKGYVEAEKAYGGCHFCYGKGYSSVVYGDGKVTIHPCNCYRGKQLEKLLKEVK